MRRFCAAFFVLLTSIVQSQAEVLTVEGCRLQRPPAAGADVVARYVWTGQCVDGYAEGPGVLKIETRLADGVSPTRTMGQGVKHSRVLGQASRNSWEWQEQVVFDPRFGYAVATKGVGKPRQILPHEVPTWAKDIVRSVADSMSAAASPSATTANSMPASTGRAPVPGGRRVALLIGNDTYQHHDLLPNSVNDARLVGDTMRHLGFEVTTVTNATRVDTISAIEQFELRAAGADAAIFYFSGHGLQDRSRRNFLMPVDARLQGEASISGYGVDIDLIVSVFERARARVSLILLDACRDWPPGRVVRVGSTKNAMLKAISRIEPTSRPDSEILVQFATREGETADPGSGANSPYALALATLLIQAPNQPIRQVLDNVMDETLRLTGGSQRPVQFGEMRVTSYLVGQGHGKQRSP